MVLSVCRRCATTIVNNALGIQRDTTSDVLCDADPVAPSFGAGAPNVQRANLDAEIDVVDQLILKLRMERARLCKKRNTLSPISLSLPPEILSEIFLYAGLSNLSSKSDSSNVTVPLLLGKVCTAWRQIAWSMSELWSCIDIRVSRKRSDTQAALLREWLERSGHRPLSISLTSENDEHSWRDALTPTAVISELASVCYKWQKIDLFLPEAWYECLSKIGNHLPLLTSVTVHPSANEFIPRPMHVFSEAPLLHEVSFSHYYLHDVSLPWGQLTKLKAKCISTDECLEAIQRSTQLVDCHFEDVYPPEDQFPLPSSPVVNQHLKILRVVLSTGTVIAPLLDRLTLPSLHSLEISLAEQSVCETLITLVERSSCPLERVDLFGATVLEEDMISFLKAVPTLREITSR